ncbi:hypothetical protein [Nonomuraea zeae]|uniref:Uncharacterized protein n=1 Tax=Nonomuraea zeae TaxID=1642303 RepID=A0A5S4G0J6_9ACTN|nr:hypothetical protein ETD85_42180 [Nonomuraea zeae]
MTRLERGYRRLLAWYPKEHRARHEEEMLAVLLAGTPPGRVRPSARDAFDVVRGGLSIRLRHAVRPESRRRWREAVDLAALVAPVVLLVAMLARAMAYAGMALPGGFYGAEAVLLLELAGYALPYGLVALAAWLGRHRAAVACAWTFALAATWLELQRDLPWSAVYVESDGVLLILNEATGLGGFASAVLPMYLCAAMLTLAPSPGPGSLGTRRVLGWTGAALATAAVGTLVAPRDGTYLAVVALMAVAAAWALRHGAGRRVIVALLPLAGPFFADGQPGAGTAAGLMLRAVPSMAALVVMAWLARGGRAAAAPAAGEHRP